MTATTARDQRIADDVGLDRETLCTATRCPRRWTVDLGSGRLCSAHAWAQPHHWPQITEELLEADAQRAYRAQYAEPKRERLPLTRTEQLQLLHRLKTAVQRMADRGSLAWAERLKARDEAGERLTLAQRQSYRAALRLDRASQNLTGENDHAE